MRAHIVLCFFLVSFCSINLSTNIFVVTGQCLFHQQSLLLHLKQNLVLNPSKSRKLVHWNQGVDCCQWNGVTCNQLGQVTDLDLSEEFISGGLEHARSLFNLQYLQNLNLAYNDFDSVIPSEVRKLTFLCKLNFSNAGFKGQIPVEISHLTRLAILDLSTSFQSNHTLKVEEPNMAVLLQNLTEMEELIMDGVNISPKGNEWLHALSSLKNLRVLSMSSCNLSGPIDSSLSKLQSLSIIQLNHNNLSSSVPDSFANFSNLTILELSSCGISGVFPKHVFHLKSLQVLDVSNNQDLQGSLPNFLEHVSLHTLNLSNTNFSGFLPYSIHNLGRLSALDLSKCQFNGTLPEKMTELTQLVYVDLSLNNFTGPLPSFNLSKNLIHLSLFHNDLGGAIPFAHFDGLVNLASIDLSDNSLDGSIPSSLFTLPSLKELMLFNNGFDGQLDEFANASSSLIEIIDLSRNNLHGPIPSSMFHLGRLRSLQLSFNKFNGTTKLVLIQKMENLSVLDLSHNNLSVDATLRSDQESSFPKMRNIMLASCNLRSFPNFLRNQSQLLQLDLSANMIQGTIPRWVSKLEFILRLNLSFNFLTNFEDPSQNLSPSLLILDLKSNQLQGPIHSFPKYGIYLDYSNNRISSINLTDIGNQIPTVFFLSFSNNTLHGRIHNSFCEASSLRILDLSHNEFNGTIPECLTRNKNLRVLKLEGNKLVGHISNTFSSSCSLRFLDLTGNHLGGAIPKSLANCQSLRVLNLAKNKLSDRFPCHLRNISTLRVLILRSNNLHGLIGCPDSIGNWEMLQIVDLASNNFVGELPGALLRGCTTMMSKEDKDKPRFSVHDLYEISDALKFTIALSLTNEHIAKKVAKFILDQPRSRVEYESSIMFCENLHSDLVSITVINKGQEVRLVKIVTAFTSMDFSSNHFEGPIPEELMNFKGLHSLNLSHNVFSGPIPSSIEKMEYLESLDFSFNSLSGEIPAQLSKLSFLAFLNLSFNNFVGPIPKGTQIQSFEAASFKGNIGLCGPPLTPNCSITNGVHGFSPHIKTSIDLNIISVELGLTFGYGILFLPLICLRQWRIRYCKLIDDILYWIFPQLAFIYEQHGAQRYRTLRWRPY